MKRRRLVLLAASCPVLRPLNSPGQSVTKPWRLGFLSPTDPNSNRPFLARFFHGLSVLGYVQDRNLVFLPRYAENHYERLSELSTDLVRAQPDAILVSASLPARELLRATNTIPVVGTNLGDPVGSGFAKSLAHPGGNLTGMSLQFDDLGTKWLETLLSIVPKVAGIGALVGPNSVNTLWVQNYMKAAGQLKLNVVTQEVRSTEDIDAGLARFAQSGVEAVFVHPENFLEQHRGLVADKALRLRLPTITGYRRFVDAGCLISYGPDLYDLWERSATFVDKIFRGSKPGELPMEQPTKFELVINERTAAALGVVIPRDLSLRADGIVR